MPEQQDDFGGWSIERKLFEFLLEAVPKDGVIVELGSGHASVRLAEERTLVSFEHDPKWLRRDRPPTWRQWHAPLVNGWYDPAVVKRELPRKYDALLIDGPPGGWARHGILQHLPLFDWHALVVIDDTQRAVDARLAILLGQYVQTIRPCEPRTIRGVQKWFTAW